jgi:uroporphyrin-III C-methyltransferase/precorrin-2 dehydrogenase/sirohydrochlorin ferrochelatase
MQSLTPTNGAVGETQVTCMAPLARLPIFFALEGKRVLVAGNGPGAVWKAGLASAAGARVDVFAQSPCEDMRALAGTPPRGTITLHERAWEIGDMSGAVLAIGGFTDDAEASRFAAAARAWRVPVNVIDKPACCDFSFGAIVNRSPLIIGISTDGAAPAFGQSIRAKLEGLIPRGFAGWANAAKEWRASVQSSGLPFALRRRFWQMFALRALARPNAEPQQSDFDALLDHARAELPLSGEGHVTLVGTGPGDAELLTLRAVRALASADVILIDDQVSPQVMEFARREAKKMLIRPCPSQSGEIGALTLTFARAGRRVVRLMRGDPAAAGAAAQDEIDACRAAGISIEVVPGVGAGFKPAPTPATSPCARSGLPAPQRERSESAPQSVSPG